MDTKYDIIEITRDYYINWVRDSDGSYYCSVPGMPEYVPYSTLRSALMQHLGTWIPKLDELDFREAGAKAYAYIRPAA